MLFELVSTWPERWLISRMNDSCNNCPRITLIPKGVQDQASDYTQDINQMVSLTAHAQMQYQKGPCRQTDVVYMFYVAVNSSVYGCVDESQTALGYFHFGIACTMTVKFQSY